MKKKTIKIKAFIMMLLAFALTTFGAMIAMGSGTNVIRVIIGLVLGISGWSIMVALAEIIDDHFTFEIGWGVSKMKERISKHEEGD